MQGHKVHHTVKTSKLKLMRIKKGLKQSDLAAASGIPLKCIGNYEQLRRNLNRAQVCTVYRLAKALGCTIEDLLEIDELSSL